MRIGPVCIAGPQCGICYSCGMDGYAEVWEKFVAERRLQFGGHTDPDWTDGHTRSASLILPVDTASWRERLEPIRDALRPFPFVSLHPDYFMHITLFFLGFADSEPDKESEADDEISPERLARTEAAARQALAGLRPFEVEVRNLNAFSAAAFLEVHDGGGLEQVRETLCSECGLQEPPGPPHLTLAYFQPPHEMRAPDDLVSALKRFRDWPVGNLIVDEVELSLLNLRSTDAECPESDYPKPEPLARIPLGRPSGGESRRDPGDRVTPSG